MIIDKNIDITITVRNITYYKSKNYDAKLGDNITVNISDLHLGSICKINVQCDNCNCDKHMEYRLYNNNLKKYGIYYCNKCKNIKSKKTKLENYGDENYNNMEQNKKTCIEKYGGHYNKLDEFKHKIKKTKLKIYGDENYNNMEQNKKTCIEKYNNDSVFNVDEIRKKIYNSRKNKLINNYKSYNLIDVDYEKYTYICNCEKNHIFEIPKTIFYNRIKTNTTLCTICNPIGFAYSDKENIICKFIQDNYNDVIVQNSRNIISPYELDIFLPDLKIAFEFNGIYWHNEIYKPNNYHLNKTELCEEKGIQLIHIYEDDWLHKQNIVKSIILNKLGKTENKIFARICEIRQIDDNSLVRSFLDENHIQGFIGSKIKVGLFYNNELVSLMVFGNRRVAMTSGDEYELLRFCNKLNINIAGGASRLFKYFINNYNPTKIIAYADRSTSQGKLYETLNFKFIGKTTPNYYYVVDGIKQNRFNFRKDILIKQGFDPNKTEHQIMLDRKIFKIYDSGDLIFNLCLFPNI